MKRIPVLLFTGTIFFSCNSSVSNTTVETKQDSSVSIKKINQSTNKANSKSSSSEIEQHKKKKIDDYISNISYIHWRANHADTTSYLCEIIFREEYAIYSFDFQCEYDYFTYKRSDTTIDLLWSYKMDCTHNLSFLYKSNGAKRSPKHGETFSTYTLINDSTLRVKYYYPEWVKRVNAIEKDSLFPTYFYLIKK